MAGSVRLCAIFLDDLDHSFTCPCLAQQWTSRHNIVKTSWHRIAARAGVHTSEELPVRFFASPPPPLTGSLLATPRGARCLPPTLLTSSPTYPLSTLRPPRQPLPRPRQTLSPLRPLGSLARRLPVPADLLRPGARGGVMFVFSYVPLSIQSFRRLGAPTLSLLRSLADHVVQAGAPSLPRDAIVSGALQELGGACVAATRPFLIQRELEEQARQLVTKLGASARTRHKARLRSAKRSRTKNRKPTHGAQNGP
jgi:hypothetical protein